MTLRAVQSFHYDSSVSRCRAHSLDSGHEAKERRYSYRKRYSSHSKIANTIQAAEKSLTDLKALPNTSEAQLAAGKWIHDTSALKLTDLET